MSDFFLYADISSLEFFKTIDRKAILVGSDFGYSNFGDVLQLKSTIEFHKERLRLEPIPVYSIEAISDSTFVETMKAKIGVNGILFISAVPIDVSLLNIELLEEIRNIGVIHLYGGGMLNALWGDYVLKVIEFFVEKIPNILYVAGGQQVGSEIRARLIEHHKKYSPVLFGVRDFDSLDRLEEWGIKGQYSFDDAYEPLQRLAIQLPKNKDNLVIGHLNISSYTRNGIDERINNILDAFNKLRHKFPDHNLSLINAYNDKRIFVSDSLASIVAIENGFPYKSYSVIDLANAAYSGQIDNPHLLAGRVGVSCSYHITMFLHFASVPCWLLSQNSYYEQKARAINDSRSFEEFLLEPNLPNYSTRIGARQEWKEKLASCITKSEVIENLRIRQIFNKRNEIYFQFKPSGAELLSNQVNDLRKYVKDLEIALDETRNYATNLELSKNTQSHQLIELRSHVEDVDSTLTKTRRYASTLELVKEEQMQQISELRAYVHDIDVTLNQTRGYVTDLEKTNQAQTQQISELRAHVQNMNSALTETRFFASNLETTKNVQAQQLLELREHIQSLNSSLDGARVFATNLETAKKNQAQQLSELRMHVQDLDSALNETRVFARNLEAAKKNQAQQLFELRTHIQSLDSSLAETRKYVMNLEATNENQLNQITELRTYCCDLEVALNSVELNSKELVDEISSVKVIIEEMTLCNQNLEKINKEMENKVSILHEKLKSKTRLLKILLGFEK